MTVMDTKQYGLRLLARHVFYDINGSQLFWDWAEGAIVTDPYQIELLTARGAPVEKATEAQGGSNDRVS
jgi:hypothetical protein